MSDLQDIGDRESDFTLKKSSKFVTFQPRHELMAKTKLREVDRKPELIFFYRRMTDDKLLYFSEGEAALMEKSSHRFMLRRLGCGDGAAYAAHIKNSGVKAGERIPIEKAQEILNGALEAELEVAKLNIRVPKAQNVHFDRSFPLEERPLFRPPPAT